MHSLLLLVTLASSPPPYQPLFELGHRFTYLSVDWATFAWDPVARLPVPALVTCEVTSVNTVAKAQVATVTCSGLDDHELALRTRDIGGVWIATTTGLFRPDVEPSTPAQIRAATRVSDCIMPERPVVQAPRERRPKVSEVTDSHAVTAPSPGVWCTVRDYGDVQAGFNTTVCFDGTALVSVSTTAAGASIGDGDWRSAAQLVLMPAP